MPPASRMPSRTRLASSRWMRLHGDRSLPDCAMPMIGRPRAQLLRRDAVVHEALEIERGHVDAVADRRTSRASGSVCGLSRSVRSCLALLFGVVRAAGRRPAGTVGQRQRRRRRMRRRRRGGLTRYRSPAARRAARASTPIEASTASLCWPSSGGARSAIAASPPKRIGLATCGTSTPLGCGTCCSMPRRLHLRILEHVGHGVDRAARHAGGVERGDQPLALPFGESRRAAAPTARRCCAPAAHWWRSARRCAHSGWPNDLAQLGELAVVADHQDHVAVGAGIDVLRLDVGMRVAVALRHLARDQVVHRLVGQRGDLHVEHRRCRCVALAGLVAPRQRGQHRRPRRTCRSSGRRSARRPSAGRRRAGRPSRR